MAIPKICGIENEYGFAIFNGKGEQVIENPHYLVAAHRFVANFLIYKSAVGFDDSKESRRNALEQSEENKESLLERAHRVLLEKLWNSSDGFLENGARFYLDGEHPEYSTPECLTPLDLVAHDKASELVMQEAIDLFLNQSAGNQYRIFVHKANSDGCGFSYGSHLNVLLSRKTVSGADNYKYLVRQYVPFQIARLVLVGGGKVGAENNQPDCRFQISQRADFFEELKGINTVEHRPIFNTRDEPHGDFEKYFRLHDISSDALRCETALFLRVALSQVVLAMIEDKYLKGNFFPKNPVEAISRVSRDLKFKDQIELENGKKMTGLELLRYYLIMSREYLTVSPMGKQQALAVNYALKLLEQLEKDPMLTFGKLDWTTVLRIAELSASDREAKKEVNLFKQISLKSRYNEFLKNGKIHRLLSDEEILRAKNNPPLNTRAYLRTAIAKKLGADVRQMSWSLITANIGSEFRAFNLDSPILDKEKANMLLSNLEFGLNG